MEAPLVLDVAATPSGWAIGPLREWSGRLAIEIDDVPSAIRRKDVPWVGRFLNALPDPYASEDAPGKPASGRAAESGNDEIAPLFERRTWAEVIRIANQRPKPRATSFFVSRPRNIPRI